MLEFIDYLAALDPLQTVGLFGFLTYIVAFGSVQFGLLDGNCTTYSLANILAASLVGISLISEFNLASALIQGSWIVIGIVGLGLRVWKAWPSTSRVLTTTLETETK